jgi:hypothetical protein
MQAKFAARLGFASPTEYANWIARGAPEDELGPACRPDHDAPLVDEEDSERLQLQSDAAIAKMRGVSPNVVTAERKRLEPPPPPQPPQDPKPDPDIAARRETALKRARELEAALPRSAISRHLEEWNRRAAELGPIPGF